MQSTFKAGLPQMKISGNEFYESGQKTKKDKFATPKPPSGSKASGGFGHHPRTPAPKSSKANGRLHLYPISKNNEMFKKFHSAWLQGWDVFVQRMLRPDEILSPASSNDPAQCNAVLAMLMELGQDIPAICQSTAWEEREMGLTGSRAQEAVQRWGGAFTESLTDGIQVSPQTLQQLVQVLGRFKTPSSNSKDMTTVRSNRLLCAQLLSKAAANPRSSAALVSNGVLDAIFCQLSAPPEVSPTSESKNAGKARVYGCLNFKEEDLAVQCILHVLIQTGAVWKIMGDKYNARDWGRSAFQPVQLLLAPKGDGSHSNASNNARGRAMMVLLTRISSDRCPPHHIEHSRSLLEVPHLLSSIVYWFYNRQNTGQNFAEVVEEVTKHLIAASARLPAFMSKAVRKALKFGSPCSYCKQTDELQPLSTSCSCLELFYCSDRCRDDHWPEHQGDCKRSWHK